MISFPATLFWVTAFWLLSLVSADHSSRYFQCPTNTAPTSSSTISATRIDDNQDFLTNPVILRGKRFFDSVTGDYFPVKGIAYYPRPNAGNLATDSQSVDFFTNDYRHVWEPDIQRLAQLGVNTIRIYAVDPSQNHDAFMCALQNVGIYAIVGLLADCQGCGIGPDINADIQQCYPKELKRRGQWIMNEFSKYSNTLLFSAGNEVTLYATNREIQRNAVCQKKFLRDMRSYVNTCLTQEPTHSILPRPVPIGMVNWDVERTLQTLYFNCRTNATDALENAEWYGLNAYQHCDGNAVALQQLEGWIRLKEDFDQYQLPTPVIVAEYGCRERGFPTLEGFEAQRTWLQVDALYSDDYAQTFAGGVVFEYSAEKVIVDTSSQNNPWPYNGFMKLQYGIGYYSPIDCDHANNNNPCTYQPYPEFDLLARKFQALKENNNNMPSMDEYSPPTTALPQCPEGLQAVSDFDWSFLDEEPDLPCYVVPTPAPTATPTTASPTITTSSPTASPSSEGQTDNGDGNPVIGSSSSTTSGGDTSSSSSSQWQMWVTTVLLWGIGAML